MKKIEVKKSIKIKFLYRFLFMGLLIISVFVALMMYTFNKNTENLAIRTIQNIQGVYQNLISNDIKMLSSSLESFATNNAIKDIFIKKDREALVNAAKNIYQNNRDRYGITHFYFINDDGKCLLRMHKNDYFDDLITRSTFNQAKKKNVLSSGIELGKTAYALRVIMPYLQEGIRIGFIEFGEEIDHFDKIIKEKLNSDIIILGKKKFLDKDKFNTQKLQVNQKNNWSDLKDHVIISDTFGQKEYFYNNIFKPEDVKNLNKAIYLGTHKFGKKILIKGAFPFYEVGQKSTGIVYVLTDIKDQIEYQNESLILVIAIGTVLFLIFLGLSIHYLNVTVFRPIIDLSETANKISLGEDLEKKISTGRKDEIGVLLLSFERLRISLFKLMQRLKDIRSKNN